MEVGRQENSALHFLWIVQVWLTPTPAPSSSYFQSILTSRLLKLHKYKLKSTRIDGLLFSLWNGVSWLYESCMDTKMGKAPVNPEFSAFIFMFLTWKASNGRNSFMYSEWNGRKWIFHWNYNRQCLTSYLIKDLRGLSTHHVQVELVFLLWVQETEGRAQLYI